MNALARQFTAYETPPPPASAEALAAILNYYGFDYFLTNTLRKIDLANKDYAAAVDKALDLYNEMELNSFTLRRAFDSAVRDVMDDEGLTYEEALEVLAEEDYVVPVTTAMYYSVDAGDADIEYLSTLIRNRAQHLLSKLS